MSTASWQSYIDQQLLGSGLVLKAVIAGHDGTLWAKSDNIKPSKEELLKISESFVDRDSLTMTGVTMDGEKYIYLSGADRVIRCKRGKTGMHIMKTLRAILIAVFEEPTPYPSVANLVENLGDYLISTTF